MDISSDEDDFSPYGITSRDERGSDSEERHDELAKPEFEGLWTKQHKDYRVGERRTGFVLCPCLTSLEMDYARGSVCMSECLA